MNTRTVALVAVALLAGFGGGYVVSNQSSQDESMDHAMAGMTASLHGKTGDIFDQAFLREMIVHHQGAVEMAEAALRDAKHQEIKDMAQAIISAQNSEITQMQAWLKDWYKIEL